MEQQITKWKSPIPCFKYYCNSDSKFCVSCLSVPFQLNTSHIKKLQCGSSHHDHLLGSAAFSTSGQKPLAHSSFN